MKLTGSVVSELFQKCLFTDAEIASDPDIKNKAVLVQGVTSRFGLHPERLESHSEEISSLLDELPAEFQEETGGGMSFLNACMDKNGQQWGGQKNVQELMVLGIGLKKVEYCLPIELWGSLPGGVPYFVVKK